MHKHCRIKKDTCVFCFHSGMKEDGSISKDKVSYCAKYYGDNRINQMLKQGIRCPDKKKVDKIKRMA